MDCDVALLAPLDGERLINSIVVPRPIAGVTIHDRDGVRNLAPLVTSISCCLSGTAGHIVPRTCASVPRCGQ
jgi:hypothetical protein